MPVQLHSKEQHLLRVRGRARVMLRVRVRGRARVMLRFRGRGRGRVPLKGAAPLHGRLHDDLAAAHVLVQHHPLAGLDVVDLARVVVAAHEHDRVEARA